MEEGQIQAATLRPSRARVWLHRYLPAEIVGTSAALLAAAALASGGVERAVIAAAWAEAIAFYAFVTIREFRRLHVGRRASGRRRARGARRGGRVRRRRGGRHDPAATAPDVRVRGRARRADPRGDRGEARLPTSSSTRSRSPPTSCASGAGHERASARPRPAEPGGARRALSCPRRSSRSISTRSNARTARVRRALPRVGLHYAVKCNPEPALLARLHALGAGFEVASLAELKLLAALGIDADARALQQPGQAARAHRRRARARRRPLRRRLALRAREARRPRARRTRVRAPRRVGRDQPRAARRQVRGRPRDGGRAAASRRARSGSCRTG